MRSFEGISTCIAGVGECCSSDLQLHRDWFWLLNGYVQLQLLQQQCSEVNNKTNKILIYSIFPLSTENDAVSGKK